MNNLIEIKNLSKSYVDGGGKKLTILDDLSISFVQNKTTSIVGDSGSGKTTLLNLLGGLDHPTNGKVFFKEEEIFSFKRKKLSEWRNQNVGFVFQAHHLLPDFTALENVFLPALISGKPKQVCEKKAIELLQQVNLGNRLEHKPNQLSGGEQQRVAIARALVNSPDLILADEPTGSLDGKTGTIVADLLKSICKEQHKTLVIVTHNTDLAASMDFKLELKNGKVEIQS